MHFLHLCTNNQKYSWSSALWANHPEDRDSGSGLSTCWHWTLGYCCSCPPVSFSTQSISSLGYCSIWALAWRTRSSLIPVAQLSSCCIAASDYSSYSSSSLIWPYCCSESGHKYQFMRNLWYVGTYLNCGPWLYLCAPIWKPTLMGGCYPCSNLWCWNRRSNSNLSSAFCHLLALSLVAHPSQLWAMWQGCTCSLTCASISYGWRTWDRLFSTTVSSMFSINPSSGCLSVDLVHSWPMRAHSHYLYFSRCLTSQIFYFLCQFSIFGTSSTDSCRRWNWSTSSAPQRQDEMCWLGFSWFSWLLCSRPAHSGIHTNSCCSLQAEHRTGILATHFDLHPGCHANHFSSESWCPTYTRAQMGRTYFHPTPFYYTRLSHFSWYSGSPPWAFAISAVQTSSDSCDF